MPNLGSINKNEIQVLAGTVMAVCLLRIALLSGLLGVNVIQFLVFFLIAASAYAVAVFFLDDDRLNIKVVWGFAILFRLILLFTYPSLSDDVYRYAWDGHLMSSGVNPYLYPVNSALLDPYNTPLRSLVNHNWMASPYLPAAQVYFMLVNWLAPQSIKGFQIAACICDLGTGWLVMDMFRMLNLPRQRVLVYLWNPLVIVEFSHAAHIDVWMIFLVSLSFWLLVNASPGVRGEKGFKWGAALAMALAVLTKGLPVIFLPFVLRRLGWLRILGAGAAVVAVSVLFAQGAGWGINGWINNGTGLFGALRIYLLEWNYNSGLYHWLETGLSGYATARNVPVNVFTALPVILARLTAGLLLGLSLLFAGMFTWAKDNPARADHQKRSLWLLRLSSVGVMVYLLFTTTLHPWYVTLIIPFLPFWLPAPGEDERIGRFMWPGLYFSCSVVLAYFSYIQPGEFQEFDFVRLVEYIPLFILLAWACIGFFKR
jgi:alpha-1,6-mannosyltransferase